MAVNAKEKYERCFERSGRAIRLAQALEQRILAGSYRHRMPTQRELVAEFNATPLTIRNALKMLERIGYVRVVPQSGVYVNEAFAPRPLRLALLLGGMSGPLHAEIMEGIVEMAHRNRLELILEANLQSSDDVSGHHALEVLSRLPRPDGAIVWPLGNPGPILQWLQARRIPFCTVMDTPCDEGWEGCSVSVDHRAAARLALEHLIKGGSRSPALLFPSYAVHVPYVRERVEACTQLALERGVALSDPILLESTFGVWDDSQDRKLAARIRRHDGMLFVLDDQSGVQTLYRMSRLGIRVPEDLSAVSINNTEWAEMLNLTSVQTGARRIGERAVELVLNQVRDPECAPVQERVAPALVSRGSSRPAPARSAGPRSMKN